MFNLAKKEYLFVIIWAVILVAVILSPHIYGYLSAPDGKQFMNTAYPGYQDANSYFTWMKQAEDGHLLFKLKYTSEPNSRVFFHPVFLIMGMLVRYFHLSETAVWYGVQILANLLFIFSIYFFISYFTEDKFRRKLALAIITLSAGFGWFFYQNYDSVSFLNLPVDISMPESTVFYSLSWPFIFSLATSLILWIFLFFLEAIKQKRMAFACFAGLATLVLGFIHPYDLFTVYFVLGIYLLIVYRLRYFKYFLIFVIISLPSSLYQAFVLIHEPIFKASAEFNMFSPHLSAYVLGFGLILLLAIPEVFCMLKTRDKKYTFCLIWILVSFCLLYIPLNIQRRLVMGMFIPIGLLASASIILIYTKLYERRISPFLRTLLFVYFLTVFFLVVSSSNIMILSGYFYKLQRKDFPLYLQTEISEALDWLKNNTESEDVVLSSWEMGNFIPRVSGNTVFIGHGAQTINVQEKQRQVKTFFNSGLVFMEAVEFLKKNNIKYIFVSPHELENNPNLPDYLADKNYFNLIFQNFLVSIYKVL